MRLLTSGLLLLIVTFGVLYTGCSKGSPTVSPAEAEKVPADAPVSEEKPSTDEK